jgi:hypothetical protein
LSIQVIFVRPSITSQISIIVCSLLLAWPCAARDIYVNNETGDDLANGRAAQQGSVGGPVRSIARALELLGKSDRLVLAATDEPYREPICLSGRHRGTARYPLVVDGGGAVLDGTVLADERAWQHHEGEVFAMRPRRLAYQQLFRNGQPLKHVTPVGWTHELPVLEPLEWTLQRGQIFLRVEEAKLPRDYDLRHAGLQTGISLYNTEHVRIENLIVQGFHTDGIRVTDTVRHCVIERVECRANGRSGIAIGGASRVTIRQATSYDNGRSQLRVEAYAHVDLEDSDLDDEGPTALDVVGGRVTVDGAAYAP